MTKNEYRVTTSNSVYDTIISWDVWGFGDGKFIIFRMRDGEALILKFEDIKSIDNI